MIPVALTSAQNVTLAVAVLVAASLAMIATACYAIYRQSESRKEITEAATKMSDEVSSSLAPSDAGIQPPDPSDFVRSLGDFASKLAALSPPVAALVVSVIPLFLAAVLVGIQLFK
jgi:Flp pilus assembly protein TadB